MIMEQQRQQVVDYSRKMLDSGLTRGTGGNISVFDRTTGYMAITPSGLDYMEMEADDVVIMDLQGKTVDGCRRPSSEHMMHSIFYRQRKDVNAVVHDHALYCSVMAALHKPLPAASYLVAIAGTDTVPCAPYRTPGTEQLAKAACKAVGKGWAAFLGNHGFIGLGPTLNYAFNVAEEIEMASAIYLQACAVGRPKVIDPEQMPALYDLFSQYWR